MITYWTDGTPEEVKKILLQLQSDKQLCRLFYGDAVTGKTWSEENDVSGRIGNSTGTHKVALLIANSRSSGGDAIMTNRVVGILTPAGWVYKHPRFDNGHWSCEPCDLVGYAREVHRDGELVARFRTLEKAERYVSFMKGERLAP